MNVTCMSDIVLFVSNFLVYILDKKLSKNHVFSRRFDRRR